MTSSAFFPQTSELAMPSLAFDSMPIISSPSSTENSSDNKKPRKNRSAYTLFALDIKPKIKASTNLKMSCVDLQTKVSQLWKTLSPEERKKYQEQANEEKLHYMLKLKKFYENATPEALEEATKPKPKRPYSAYCYFVKEVRQVIKLPDAKFKMQDILKQASEKWRLLSEEEKAVYHERAKQAKEAYMSEVPDEAVEPLRLEELPEPVKLFENKKKTKKTQNIEAKNQNLNKKRGLFFSKDIQEKMDKLNKENPLKKVKHDTRTQINLYNPQEQSTANKFGRYFGAPLPYEDKECYAVEMKQESIEETFKAFPKIQLQVQPEQLWPNYMFGQQQGFPVYNNASLPQFWNMKAQMDSNANLMGFMMGYEQMRRYMMSQMMANQTSDTASQGTLSTPDPKIEVKSENF